MAGLTFTDATSAAQVSERKTSTFNALIAGNSKFSDGVTFKLTGYAFRVASTSTAGKQNPVFDTTLGDAIFSRSLIAPKFGVDGKKYVPDGTFNKAFQAYTDEHGNDTDVESFMKAFYEAHKDDTLRVVRKPIPTLGKDGTQFVGSYVTIDIVSK